jgi:hypothetical protein
LFFEQLSPSFIPVTSIANRLFLFRTENINYFSIGYKFRVMIYMVTIYHLIFLTQKPFSYKHVAAKGQSTIGKSDNHLTICSKACLLNHARYICKTKQQSSKTVNSASVTNFQIQEISCCSVFRVYSFVHSFI